MPTHMCTMFLDSPFPTRYAPPWQAPFCHRLSLHRCHHHHHHHRRLHRHLRPCACRRSIRCVRASIHVPCLLSCASLLIIFVIIVVFVIILFFLLIVVFLVVLIDDLPVSILSRTKSSSSSSLYSSSSSACLAGAFSEASVVALGAGSFDSGTAFTCFSCVSFASTDVMVDKKPRVWHRA